MSVNASASIPDLNDSDILKIEAVLNRLGEKQSRMVSLEGFRKEAIERFAEAGFKVVAKVYETDQPGLYAFDLDIVGRTFGEFDPERQVHEATADILDLGTKGVIKG